MANRSKVERIRDLFSKRLFMAMESVSLREHRAGRHDRARVLDELYRSIDCEVRGMGTYERLELDDIIKGHKRAWPE